MKRDSWIARFNRRVPYPLRLALIGVLGIALLPLLKAAPVYGYLLYAGITAERRDCPLPRMLSAPGDKDQLVRDIARHEQSVRVVDRDREWDLVQVQTPGGRKYWIRDAGAWLPGPRLIAYLVAEHQWMAQRNPGDIVAEGDTVIDCGAHVGVFTADALARGARRVVAIEPDAANLECLRRNFKDEIEAGRVVLVPKAVWSEPTTLRFTVAEENSGMGSAVLERAGREIEVPATTIDAIVREYGIGKVDYLKMDIEGAERHALRGGMETLRRSRPRVMLEAYHLDDDYQVLPGLLREAHADYREICGPCELDGRSRSYRPYVLYYR
jgi:FkbM family methyltransferase